MTPGRLILAVIGIFIFMVILVALLFGGNKKPATPGEALKPLPDYADTNATVSFTTDGIINGDEMHRGIRITVSANQRSLDVLQGYNPRVIQSQTFVNNQEAYKVFLTAIANAGFLTKSKKVPATAVETGQCPLGFRYNYTLQDTGNDLSNLWSTSCGSKTGTSGGSTSLLSTLFQRQIPNYSNLVSNVNLSATTTQP
ncbi:hypothetical protein KW803_02020 [Candidatus Saccharibacteria bacterium]|nr:hypothetical protein [Candidatus Saccharibacteria bacterium]